MWAANYVADALEKNLIKMFNENPDITSYKEIVEIDDKKVLYVAIPFLANDTRCMRCHSKREIAPTELQQRYPGQGGFNEKLGEIRAITSIRAPMGHEYNHIYIIVEPLQQADGSRIWIDTSKVPLLDEQGKVYGVLGVYENITDRKKAEKELKIKESAIAASINAIAIADLHGNLTYVNQSFLSLWAHENEKDVLGKPVINFWQSKDEALTFMENLQKTGKWLGEMRARNKDGKTFVAQVSSGMVYAMDGQPLCIMASFLDITEKHKYEKQLSQTQRLEAIGTLSGGIAHDFNNIQVVTYTNSEDALEAFRSGPEKFDLVITDMAMPKMSGDKLAVELITIRPDIPVLLCTGFSKAMTDEKIHAMGIKGFLMKPIVTNDLAQKIRELLDKK